MNQYTLQSPVEPQVQPPAERSGLWKGIVAGTVAFVIVALLALSGAIIGYAAIVSGSNLPRPEELTEFLSDFKSTRIYDRAGNLLNETFDPNTGRRVEVPLERISPYLINATIATEDANFRTHSGVDPVALARVVYYAFLEREFVSGGSTIPQQLVKLAFLTDDATGLAERSAERKIKEAILATEVSRKYTKDQILQFYLNEIYYGNFAYGIAAAAETYFAKEPAELTLAEAALLAGLPQLPSRYDPYINRDNAKNRQGVVLGLMVEQGYISAEEANAAWQEPLSYVPLHFEFESPHFTVYVRQQLEALFQEGGLQGLYNAGLRVTTTLDPNLQAAAEQIVLEQVTALADRNVSNGALVAIDPQTGQLLALVGSADFDNVEIDGQVNMALAPRQPGSSIKPLVYLAAFEKQGWTPGTLLADIEEEFPDGANPPYRPTNYDLQEHGIVTVRSALANSYNIPAVRALQSVTIPEFLEVARRLGISTLVRPDYGLSLSLGAGEVPLLEMTGAFATLANGGVFQPPIAILKIEDADGNIVCGEGGLAPCRFGSADNAGQQVIDPANAYLLTAMLSDNNARAPMFGLNSALNIGRPAAAKTGTTNDYRDSLTIGYTPQLVAGVWVGNANNFPMDRIAGSSGAAQIWNQFMTTVLRDQPAMEFTPPAGVRLFEICADTGTQPSAACPERIQFPFAEARPPLPPEQDLWQKIRIDRATGKLATEFTPVEMIEERDFKIYPEPYRQWAEEHNIPQPPSEQSDLFTSPPQVTITSPGEGAAVQGTVTVMGSANVPGLANYELQYGVSHDPGAFSPPIWGPAPNAIENNVLGYWETGNLEPGPHTLRLVVRDQYGTEYEHRVRVFVDRPQAAEEPPAVEPTPTWTPTWTPIADEPALPTETPTPSFERPLPEEPGEPPLIEAPTPSG